MATKDCPYSGFVQLNEEEQYGCGEQGQLCTACREDRADKRASLQRGVLVREGQLNRDLMQRAAQKAGVIDRDEPKPSRSILLDRLDTMPLHQLEHIKFAEDGVEFDITIVLNNRKIL